VTRRVTILDCWCVKEFEMVFDASLPRAIEPAAKVVSFDDFYRDHYAPLVRIGWSLTGRRWVAEELAQEAFLTAHRRWGSISQYDDPAAWIRRVMINRSLSVLRRTTTEARGLVRWSNLARRSELELPEDAAELWQALRRLPRRQTEVLVLVIVEDMAAADVATVLGCGVDTVRTHLRRGRLALATALGADAGADAAAETEREDQR
jgi:RNA polymerase sigma factor (sigma-70 family)